MAIEVKWKSRCGSFSSGLSMKLSEAKEFYAQAVESLKASPTAVEVINYVTSHKTSVDLICVPGGEGEFLFPGEMAQLKWPTIIWDPNKHFQFFSNVAAISNVVYADKKSYQPAIVLLHEMGHCKQWLEAGDKHERLVRQGKVGVAEVERDNLERHEGPVARELGLSVRKHYQHFPNSPMLIDKDIKLLHSYTEGPSGKITTGARNSLT